MLFSRNQPYLGVCRDPFQTDFVCKGNKKQQEIKSTELIVSKKNLSINLSIKNQTVTKN